MSFIFQDERYAPDSSFSWSEESGNCAFVSFNLLNKFIGKWNDIGGHINKHLDTVAYPEAGNICECAKNYFDLTGSYPTTVSLTYVEFRKIIEGFGYVIALNFDLEFFVSYAVLLSRMFNDDITERLADDLWLDQEFDACEFDETLWKTKGELRQFASEILELLDGFCSEYTNYVNLLYAAHNYVELRNEMLITAHKLDRSVLDKIYSCIDESDCPCVNGWDVNEQKCTCSVAMNFVCQLDMVNSPIFSLMTPRFVRRHGVNPLRKLPVDLFKLLLEVTMIFDRFA